MISVTYMLAPLTLPLSSLDCAKHSRNKSSIKRLRFEQCYFAVRKNLHYEVHITEPHHYTTLVIDTKQVIIHYMDFNATGKTLIDVK